MPTTDSPDPRPENGGGASAPKAALFREEAVRLHLRAREYGEALARPPRWTAWAFPLVVATMLALLAWVALSEAPRQTLSELLNGRRATGRH
jgi:hypothetical protein